MPTPIQPISEQDKIQHKKDFEELCDFLISQGFEEDFSFPDYLKNTFRLFHKTAGLINQKLEIQVNFPIGDHKGGVFSVTHNELHHLMQFFTITKVQTFKMLIENNSIFRRYFAFQ